MTLHLQESGRWSRVVDEKESDILVHADEDVKGTLFIETSGNASDVRMEIILDPGADMQCIVLLREAADYIEVSQRARIAEGASLRWYNITLGEGEIHQYLVTELIGPHATSDISWIFNARGGQKMNLSARNVFLAAEGAGEIIMRGVARDHAHVKASGMIQIGPEGRGTNTYLTQDVLMLDPTAKVDAIPGLEIKTNDVKASHSATVSRVTAEDLFYFGARGIPQAQAKTMYVEGFLGSIIETITDQDVKERIQTSAVAI